MKNNLNIIIVLLILLIVGIFLYSRTLEPKTLVTNNPEVVTEEDLISGCYVATLGQDIYTLNIQTQIGEIVEGRLVFKNFQKDSSSGAFNGTYKNGILLGDYSFSSEGTNSVMEVVFKKVGNDFVRGYGDMTTEGNMFADLNNINYDSSAVFKASSGNCATSLN